MKYTNFNEHRFHKQVDNALISVKRILDTSRNPRLAHDHEGDSRYEDKYALVALLTQTSLVAHMNVLERLGVKADHLNKMTHWVHQQHKTVTMRFEAIQTCKFLEMKEVSVVTGSSGIEQEVERRGKVFGKSSQTTSIKHKVTTLVKEYHWKVCLHHKLIVFAGASPDEAGDESSMTLQQRNASTVIYIKGTEKDPFLNLTKHHPIDVNMTWFLEQMSASKKNSCTFAIDRSNADTCKTPRRNTQVDAAVEYFQGMEVFAKNIKRFLLRTVEADILGRHAPAAPTPTSTGTGTAPQPRLIHISAHALHCPILPLFEKKNTVASTITGGSATPQQQEEGQSLVAMSLVDDQDSPVLSSGDMNKFLEEQVRTLDEALGTLKEQYPAAGDDNAMISTAEATLSLVSLHLVQLANQYEDAVDYIEHMLKKQLVAAIGKEMASKDFDQFMSFHYQTKLYGPFYAPRPFCFAIRRPGHYPDGILSIEAVGGADGNMEPIETFTRYIPASDTTPPIRTPLNAATTVEMTGDRYLHGWIKHSFDSSRSPWGAKQYQLAARARQFSCFLVMVGTMAGPDKFSPKEAIVLQNKDEVLIPLLLNELPSATEFKDAISSLSPEQQRFAKSFRGMQLESSVFGVCVVQLKPQLEDLLELPQGALTKEMQLTQDLLSLFIDYQIPSDLLAFDGSEGDSKAQKIAAVKEYTKSVLDVIQGEKDKQLKLETEKADMAIEKRVQDRQAIIHDSHNSTMAMAANDWTEDTMHDDEEGAVFQNMSGLPRRSRGGAPSDAMSFAASVPVRRLRKASRHVERSSAIGAFACSAAPPDAVSVPERSIARGGAPPPGDPGATRSHQPTTSEADIKGRRDASGVLDVDFTMIPKALDAKFEAHDTDSSLRATIIKTGDAWSRKRQESLLTKVATAGMGPDEIKSEKDKAFDLLDALSRSGSLPLAYSELHVVVAVTHGFDNDIMGTVLQDNINPIEKVEKSSLLVASTIHGVPPQELLQNGDHVARLQGSFPALFDGGA